MSHRVSQYQQRRDHWHHSDRSLGGPHSHAKGKAPCGFIRHFIFKHLYCSVLFPVINPPSGFTGGLHPSPHGEHWDISNRLSLRDTRWERKTFIRVWNEFHHKRALFLHFSSHFEWTSCRNTPASGRLIWALRVFNNRRKHGDAGPPGIVGGGPELRPRHRARRWKLLWSSWVYVLLLFPHVVKVPVWKKDNDKHVQCGDIINR